MYPHTKRNSAECEEMYWEKPKFHNGKIALFIKVYRERHPLFLLMKGSYMVLTSRNETCPD